MSFALLIACGVDWLDWPMMQKQTAQFWWCNTHEREATKFKMLGDQPYHYCEGPGITLPCSCVNLTGIAEIKESR